jgi:hypothetical protein
MVADAIATKSGIADCNELAGEVLAVVLCWRVTGATPSMCLFLFFRRFFGYRKNGSGKCESGESG